MCVCLDNSNTWYIDLCKVLATTMFSCSPSPWRLGKYSRHNVHNHLRSRHCTTLKSNCERNSYQAASQFPAFLMRVEIFKMFICRQHNVTHISPITPHHGEESHHNVVQHSSFGFRQHVVSSSEIQRTPTTLRHHVASSLEKKLSNRKKCPLLIRSCDQWPPITQKC